MGTQRRRDRNDLGGGSDAIGSHPSAGAGDAADFAAAFGVGGVGDRVAGADVERGLIFPSKKYDAGLHWVSVSVTLRGTLCEGNMRIIRFTDSVGQIHFGMDQGD